MHSFLKSIGFSDVKRKDLEIIIREVVEHPDQIQVAVDSEGNDFAELSKEYAEGIGVMVRGVYRSDDIFEVEYYLPYYVGSQISSMEQVEVHRHAEKESYAGVSDELRLGVTLIFYIQNVAQFLAYKCNGRAKRSVCAYTLSALALSGKILLPVGRKKGMGRYTENKYIERTAMISKAREGDEEAIESLTVEDMDTYSLISKRIMFEDVMSIVDTSFMPFGVESDQYSILGHIHSVEWKENWYTKEEMCCMQVECNDITIDICINKKDMLGEPKVGRRFKGNIWMQGILHFE